MKNKMEIIPAIDLIDGKCVRLTQGDYEQKKIYNEDPLEAAKQFEDGGIRRLHLVDLDGARTGKIVNHRILEKIAQQTKLVVDFGGGIKNDEAIKMVFDSGAAMATLGSVAVKDRILFLSWIKKYGEEKILLGADVKNEMIAINGWKETTTISIVDFIEENMNLGIKTIFCTDISRDGLLQGPAVELYRKLIIRFPDLKLIASGGVASVGDLEKLSQIGCSGAIVGKAIYEGKINMNTLKSFVSC